MKTRHSPPHALVARCCLSSLALLLGAGLAAFAVHAAGSFAQVLENIRDGTPGAPGFLPFVLGVVCMIYGAVGLIFRRDDREED